MQLSKDLVERITTTPTWRGGSKRAGMQAAYYDPKVDGAFYAQGDTKASAIAELHRLAFERAACWEKVLHEVYTCVGKMSGRVYVLRCVGVGSYEVAAQGPGDAYCRTLMGFVAHSWSGARIEFDRYVESCEDARRPVKG